MLKVQQIVACELSGHNYTVKKKIGEGGQGTVFLVEEGQSKKVIKWYNPEQATEDQKNAISTLIRSGAPKGEAGKRFIWPLDIVAAGKTPGFGYLMDLIDTTRFGDLCTVWAKEKPSPTMKNLIQICHTIAKSFRALHLEGYCYRDISIHNIMFDSATGEVLICDNDNVGINKQSKSQVWGTLEYMAPEIIMNRADPSTLTDLYSLAVIFFELWMWHHPMHGKKEYEIRSWDLPAKQLIYGKEPVFIFNPKNTSNELPNDPDYKTPKNRWQNCPGPLRELFMKSFTAGLADPDKRVTEGEWQDAFQELLDCLVVCPHDSAENIWYPGLAEMTCWHCKRRIHVPPRLQVQSATGNRHVTLTRGAKIYHRHINPHDISNAGMLVGELVQNPNNPDVWGIKNHTPLGWAAVFTDGREKEVPPQKSVPLSDGVKIRYRDVTCVIQF